ncbi:uncharacterized protein cubi_02041 [Cryptosporidium ubiquitum]|uniref:Uncharacterized protein n=1 Tax=Cryptosporidium ubiquitum TaxID=857276 RepID=A0A1J4MMV4_9CRYT|nr:uncharacterized protein cubi_02041 [Cryptosporidium ubiquitum]OII75520.1 hypothetical protein cubi_02041 [Cryptosporidium ubiquitum]
MNAKVINNDHGKQTITHGIANNYLNINNEDESFEVQGESFNTSNIISLLRFNLNNENESREKVLNQIYNLMNKRMPIKYSNVQKKTKTKGFVSSEDKLPDQLYTDHLKNKNKDLSKNHLKNVQETSVSSDLDKESILNNNNNLSNDVEISTLKISVINEYNIKDKQISILFDYILSTLLISDQLEVKLDILTLLEEQYETILGKPEQILTDKRCWDRYNTAFNIFEHIIAANYKEIARESINLFEASTILSGSNSISVDNIYQELINNPKYSIPIILQSQTLIAFTSIALSLNLLEVVPFWFSKLLSILFIISKEDCVKIQKFQDRNPLLFQNYFSILRKYAIECLIEINRSYPLIFCPLIEINPIPNLENEQIDLKKQGLGFIQKNIHPSIWPDNFEKEFITDCKNFNKNNIYNDQLIELIINIIITLIVNNQTKQANISKVIKEKERFLTYLVTYIMENLKSVSCWNLHKRILFLKKITKTLLIPSNILESSLLPFSYSSRIHILFEICIFILEEISKESFSNAYHHIIGILNNFHFPITFRIYSSKWIQFVISKYSGHIIEQTSSNQNNTLAKFIHHLLIPKWHDFCKIKYFKSLIILQLKFYKVFQCNNDEDFLEILYESLNSLQEYIIIKAPIGAHSIYLKLLFKISILIGINQHISDLIIKYTCHPNFQISSDHINNSIQLLHLISIYSENRENFEHILLLFETFLNHIKTLNNPRDIDPFLMVLIYLSQKSRLFTEMGNHTVISDLINSLFYISKVFLEKIHKPVLKWIYMNKIYTVFLSIITNNMNNYNVVYLLNNLFGYVKSQLKTYDTQLLDSISEIEYSMNYMSLKNINSLFGMEDSEQKELKLNNLESISKQEESNLKGHVTENETKELYKIRLDIYKKFRRQIYGLRDNSFSIFSKNTEHNALILPFQIRYLEINEIQTCLYGIKLSFKSSNNSLGIEPVYIPFLKPQNIQEIEKEDIDEKMIEKYLEEGSSKVINMNNNIVFLLLIAKVKFPIPGKLHIYLEFNDEFGHTFYDQLEDIQISFQDYFHPSPDENWTLKCYKALSLKLLDSEHSKIKYQEGISEIINTCKLLDIPSNLVLNNINKHLRIFEIDGNRLLSMIDEKFSIKEEFDFKHDLLIRKIDLKKDNLIEKCEIEISYRWFCIHLPPKYYLIIQFSITNKSSIIRIYTDFPEILSHCDNFFDTWG